jgi:hypothetical protein
MKKFCKHKFLAETIEKKPDFIRKGQAVYNNAHIEWPDIVGPLAGSEKDCYFDDSKIPVFLNHIERIINESLAK